MESDRVYLCGLILGCLIVTIRAQSNESIPIPLEPEIDVYDENPSNNVLPVGEGDTAEPRMEPDDNNSTLLEPTPYNLTESEFNSTDYEQPIDLTTPMIDTNYVDYYSNLEKMLNKTDPAGDFNYHYPDSYDYNFNLSTTDDFNYTKPRTNNPVTGFFQVTPEIPGPSLFMPPGATDLQRAYSPPFVRGGIIPTMLETNPSRSNASSRTWPADSAGYSASRFGIIPRTGLDPSEFEPRKKPTMETTSTTTMTSTKRSTTKTTTKRSKVTTSRTSRKPKTTSSSTTKRSKEFRSIGESRTATTTTTTQPPNVRRSLKKPDNAVRRERRNLGPRNRTTTTSNAMRRRRTRTGKRFRRIRRPTPTARRRPNPLVRPRQRQRPWAMPPLMLDYEFWMF